MLEASQPLLPDGNWAGCKFGELERRAMKTIYEASKAANEAPPESMFSCLMRVMQRGDIGLKAIAGCADAIAADARFNIRMAEVEEECYSRAIDGYY